MKTITKIIIWITLLNITNFATSVAAEDSSGYWKLKGTWHTEIHDVLSEHFNNTWTATVADGNVSAVETVKDIHIANDPKIYTFNYAYTFSIQGTNQSSKEKLFPGDEVEIIMTLSYQGIDPQILYRKASMYAGAFNNYPSDNLIAVSNPGGSGSKTIKVKVPSGVKPGTENYIKVHCVGGYQPIEFVYVYQWVEADRTAQSDEKEITGTTENTKKQTEGTTSNQSEPNSTQSPASGKPDESTFEDSGARFDSVTGAVEISVDPDSDEWERCTPRTRIPVEAHIRPMRDSSAIIRFSDGNLYVLRPNTEIVIKRPPKGKSKFQLIMGKLWSNTKKILTDGSIEIETSQAVAGIKGTTYVIEADGNKTVLKVIEGTVAFTSKASGKTVDVTGGQKGIADNFDILTVENFDVKAEQEQWNKIIREANGN